MLSSSSFRGRCSRAPTSTESDTRPQGACTVSMNAAYRLRIGCNASNAPDHERSLLHGLSDSSVSGFEPTPAYTVGHERFHISVGFQLKEFK